VTWCIQHHTPPNIVIKK